MSSEHWSELGAEDVSRFLNEHRAALDVIRTSLPTHYARAVVSDRGRDNSVMPSELWSSGDQDFAFVWWIRAAGDNAQKRRIVAFFRISPDTGVTRVNNAPEGLPDGLKVEQVDFSKQFWKCHWGDPDAASDDSQEDPKSPDDERNLVDSIAEDETHIENVLRQDLSDGNDAAGDAGWEMVQPDVPAACVDWQPVVDEEDLLAIAERLVAARVTNFTMESPCKGRYLVLARETPFYPEFRLYRIIDLRGRRSRFTNCVLSSLDDGPGDACLLGTKSAPIHAFNKRRKEQGGLVIDGQTVVPYLRFFCEFMHAAEGAFPIIEHASEVRWLNDGRMEDGSAEKVAVPKHAFERAIRPVRVLCRTQVPELPTAAREAADSAIHCSAFLGYGRVIFLAAFKVAMDGQVQMLDDRRPYDRDLPIEPLSFNREYQFELVSDTLISAEVG